MKRLSTPTLCLVTNTELAGSAAAMIDIAAAATEAGVNMVVVREPRYSAAELSSFISQIQSVISRRALLVVHSAREVAVKLGADGVHYRDGAALPPKTDGLLTGQSLHYGSALSTVDAGRLPDLDYIFLGTIFQSQSHPERDALPLGFVRRVCRAYSPRVRVLGIGGVTHENARQVVEAGADGVAVMRSVITADNPALATELLLKILV